MWAMAEHSEEADVTRDARMGKAILKGLAVGLPISIVLMTIAVWLITDLDLADSFATALWPAILFGGFAGGFAGVASTMD
jgi:heme/copper-type cytochrome/quinol oxidase subunit 4